MSYEETIKRNLNNCLIETNLDCGKKFVGKVRDTYELDNKIILITTDRQSAFDKVLASIPFKGQVLNQTSAWWFKKTKHIVPNYILDVPDPNVTVGKKCTVFPVEMVVRGYITGTTDTSAWTNYQKGARNLCGNMIPDGMKKNQKFNVPIITPTTKSDDHDQSTNQQEIISKNLMTQVEWDYISLKALELFRFGQAVAQQNGLILVDTKYEFGKDADGNILLIDEIHTPDSSRYWIAETYEERFSNGQEPENIDKEFLRLWFKENCDPYNDQTLPEAPKELVTELSKRYIQLYEMITGETFDFGEAGNVEERMRNNLKDYLPDDGKIEDATVISTVVSRNAAEVNEVERSLNNEICDKKIPARLTEAIGTGGKDKAISDKRYMISDETINDKFAVLILGSVKDEPHAKKITDKLTKLNINFEQHIASAHKQAAELLQILEKYKNDKVVYITIAGRSNALSGFVAGNSDKPVIACPPFADKLDMMININSTLQMPSNVPVMTVLDPDNAALAVRRIVN